MANSNRTSKIGTIVRHEYTTKVKSKWFIIGTLIGPLGILLFLGVIVLITVLSMDETSRKLAIVDKSGEIGRKLEQTDTSKYYIVDKTPEQLNQQILDGEIDGYIVLHEDILNTGEAAVYSKGGGGIGFISALEGNLKHILRRERLINSGADERVLELVEKGVSINTQKITKEGAQEDYTAAYTGLGYVLSFAMYILMLLYGSFVSRGVIEEKANRIVEVIASSARPFEIMFGKVVGIGASGLTQVIFWLILSVILIFAAGPIVGMFIESPEAMTEAMGPAAAGGAGMPQDQEKIFEIINAFKSVSPWLAVGFLFYFLSGYFIYATLFAAIGSAVDQEQDAAQLQTPVTFLIIIPMLFISPVMNNPDGTLAVGLSLFPFFTPIIMMLRIAATNVPLWQIALSVVLMTGTFLGALWVSGKIYRIGILMTGQKPKIGEMIKWLKA